MEFPFTPPTAPNWQSVASTSRQFQQVPPFQSPPSQQYKLRPVPNNDSLRAHREMRELLARLQDDGTASGDQPRIEGQDECLDEESWFHMQNCVERIGLIANLINMPAFGNKISVALKRKLNYLSKLELVEEKDRYKAMRTSILIGQRYLCEFLHRHNDSHQTIATLWNAVRSRGCQFLGPAIQEEILKLVILALEDGESLTRKVLILFIMQRLMPHFPLQTSKTAIGHVIQILYRGSCFDVTKRDGESSLMSLKPDFRNYDALRREHDAQIVSIALEVGLRISPEQWSSLLYGDNDHKSVMQSIIDKQYKTNPPFGRMIQRLREQLTKFNDPCRIQDALVYFEQLAYFETNIKDESACTMEYVSVAIDAVSFLTIKILSFLQHFVWKMYDP